MTLMRHEMARLEYEDKSVKVTSPLFCRPCHCNLNSLLSSKMYQVDLHAKVFEKSVVTRFAVGSIAVENSGSGGEK